MVIVHTACESVGLSTFILFMNTAAAATATATATTMIIVILRG